MPDPATHTAYIGLGSNLSDPAGQVRTALAGLDRLEATRVRNFSSLYRGAPAGYADQPDFVNAVAEISTRLEPHALLHQLLRLEQTQGRVRTFRNGPRTLDLDLLLYDAECIQEADLTLPHPRMHERAFVLVPLLEIAPEAQIPGRGPASRLLAHLEAHGLQRLGG